MRIFLGFFALAAVATSAFAVGELRALRHHETPVTPPVVIAPDEPEPVLAAAPAVPRQLSTWKGANPFGGVPTNVEDDDNDSHDDIIDEEDRCPDTDDSDGDYDSCPDPEVTHRVIIKEGPPRRVITIDSTIFINGDIQLEKIPPEVIIY